MTNILLSICIATYNREAFICKTLESIIPQLDNDIEIIIVDGGSTDNTEKIVFEYKQQCNSIKYFKLDKKGGIDQDYDKAVQLSNGKYCWLFSDDDIIKTNALIEIKTKILTDPSLIIVNAELRSLDLKKVLKKKYLNIHENNEFESNANTFEDFFLKNAEYLSFIGCVIIKREIWMSRERVRYYNTRFIHVGIIFQELLPNRIIVLHQSYIIIRLGNAEWTKLGFEIWMFFWPILIHSFKHFKESYKTIITPKNPYLKYTTLISQRALNAYQLENYEQLLRPVLKSKFRKIISYTIAVTPRYFFLILLVLYSVITNNQVLKYNLIKSAR